MTDIPAFERQLADLLRGRAARASKPFDAGAIARRAIIDSGRRGGSRGIAWPVGQSARSLILVVVLLTLTAVAVLTLAGGSMKLAWPWEAVVDQSPTTSVPVPSTVPSAEATQRIIAQPWPGTRADQGRGLYYWDMQQTRWMHNVGVGQGVALTFALGGMPDGTDATEATVAGHGALYRRVMGGGTIREQWEIPSIEGMTVLITLEADAGTSEASLNLARDVVASLRLEAVAGQPGYRLVFETLGGWDSG